MYCRFENLFELILLIKNLFKEYIMIYCVVLKMLKNIKENEFF